MSRQSKHLHKASTDGRSRDILAAVSPDREKIARLAYLYWLGRGCPIGSPEEDWSRAEQELKNEQAQTA